MKKIAYAALMVLLLCSCAGGQRITERLQRRYPDAQIVKTADGYEARTANVPDVPADEYGEDLEAVTLPPDERLQRYTLTRNAVFIGTKTQEHTQVTRFDRNGVNVFISYTVSVFEVRKPLYGDIRAGDRVSVSENYYVIDAGYPKKQTHIGVKPVAVGEEQVFMVTRDSTESPYGGELFYLDQTEDKDVFGESLEIDPAVEARKLLERELTAEQAKRGKNDRRVKALTELLEGDADYGDLYSALNTADREVFDRCLAD